MKQFTYVPMKDLVRVLINGKWVSVHRNWYTNYPWKVQEK